LHQRETSNVLFLRTRAFQHHADSEYVSQVGYTIRELSHPIREPTLLITNKHTKHSLSFIYLYRRKQHRYNNEQYSRDTVNKIIWCLLKICLVNCTKTRSV